MNNNFFSIYVAPFLYFLLVIFIGVKVVKEFRAADSTQKRKLYKQLLISTVLTVLFISFLVYYLTRTA